ncbi:hypothetical protein JCM33374_g3916 [Metschnikowia sp. JCM 33374]|nr:hypothetical protein JCM33374_g3916 [Metschnikowia sp. JCM 33374]
MFGKLAHFAVLSLFAFSLPTITTRNSSENNDSDGKCELVGTFSLLTQAFLGLLCLSSLIVKRFYEYPVRRTWQVWFYDVSKQVVGAFGVHIFNLMLSILKTSPSQPFLESTGEACEGSGECTGDPCDWYFLSIVLDCTIGVYILYLVLLLVSTVCKDYLGITQIESGEYGPDDHHPSMKAFSKQLALYFGSLMITKFLLYGFVECFEDQLLWITSHIILSWLDEYPNEFEIFIVMFVVPIFMNCLQLILVDNIIQNKTVHRSNHKFVNERSNLLSPNVDEQVSVMNKSDEIRPGEDFMSVN